MVWFGLVLKAPLVTTIHESVGKEGRLAGQLDEHKSCKAKNPISGTEDGLELAASHTGRHFCLIRPSDRATVSDTETFVKGFLSQFIAFVLTSLFLSSPKDKI